jgi:hypothetical protein
MSFDHKATATRGSRKIQKTPWNTITVFIFFFERTSKKGTGEQTMHLPSNYMKISCY